MHSSSTIAKLPERILYGSSTDSSITKEQKKLDRYGNFFAKRKIDVPDIEST